MENKIEFKLNVELLKALLNYINKEYEEFLFLIDDNGVCIFENLNVSNTILLSGKINLNLEKKDNNLEFNTDKYKIVKFKVSYLSDFLNNYGNKDNLFIKIEDEIIYIYNDKTSFEVRLIEIIGVEEINSIMKRENFYNIVKKLKEFKIEDINSFDKILNNMKKDVNVVISNIREGYITFEYGNVFYKYKVDLLVNEKYVENLKTKIKGDLIKNITLLRKIFVKSYEKIYINSNFPFVYTINDLGSNNEVSVVIAPISLD